MRALGKKSATDVPAEVASRISTSLQQERVVPRFVDSYVVEHGRYALQVHAALYRDLLALLQREALLAATARALELSAVAPATSKRSKPRPVPRKDAALFRRKYLGALTRLQKWTAGDALDFQNDLQVYEELLLRVGAARRRRKPFEAANHPFVDRCAFLLDSSFLEKARLAASRALADVDEVAEHAFTATLQAARAFSARA
ncbi:MAG: hypothetical protein ABSG69_12330 [Candidatus Acidiferrum sp.]|jgi:hypothetical protein